MYYLSLVLILSLGGYLKAQAISDLREPPQSWVFHLENRAAKSLPALAAEVSRAFPFLAQVLLCEQHGYLVCIPREPVASQVYERLGEDLHTYLRQQGFIPYLKEGARVVELAQDCDQLVKPLLAR
ncbi:MAG: hypothetical protein RMK19_09250 [Bacteroidia bacterium]|nr:hypothetical protein [Bacteroidia bacterium]